MIRNAHRLACGLIIVLLSACTGTPQSRALLHSQPADIPSHIELTATPFYPQQRHQCGPAALTTTLNWSGLNLTPDQLTPQVYLPGREGSLQLELIAASRRHLRIPYLLKPELSQLLAEVAAGHPVLVLQNLGLDMAPRWHYAVVIGYNLSQELIILRSGTVARMLTPIKLFERTWARGGHWALLTLPPGRIPATASESNYLLAVAALERLDAWPTVANAYTAATQRWPNSEQAQFALGNAYYQLGELGKAENAWRQAIALKPSHSASLNNLAVLLTQQRRREEARELAQRALSLEPQNNEYLRTLHEIK